jgi:hypothetical protein
MFLNMRVIADWQAIACTCEHRQYDYAPGQQALKKVQDPTKLGVRTEGPYTIERVHINGNLTILLREGIT